MPFQPNDKIILIDDESPEQHSARTGRKFGKRGSRPGAKVGFIDRVISVTPVQVVCAGGFRCALDGRELPGNAADRRNNGLPARRCLKIPPNAFPLPAGMQAKIDVISLDPATIEAFQRYTDGFALQRSTV